MTPTAINVANPFPGLRPFQESEADLFFGQEDQIAELTDHLGMARFVSVVGVSGCGKSSLVHAGLLARLRRMSWDGKARWLIVKCNPGNSPVSNLVAGLSELAALADHDPTQIEQRLRLNCRGLVELVTECNLPPDQRVLVFVDQFEELFRFRREENTPGTEDESALFVKLLLEAAQDNDSPIYVVTTMRSDFLGDCSLFYGLAEAMNRGLYLLPKMSRAQCEEVITAPVEARGVRMDPALTQFLLNETEEQEDGLPLLQHALMRVWEYWIAEGDPERPITFEDFDVPRVRSRKSTSLVEAHLDDHLDSIYGHLPDEHKKLAERIFKLLGERDSKGREARRALPLDDVIAATGARQDDIIAVIDQFRDESRGRTFLRPAKGLECLAPIDISHECLLRRWKLLREWIDQESHDADEFRRLADEADRAEEYSSSQVLQGVNLRTLLYWWETASPQPNWSLRYRGAMDPTLHRHRRDYSAARDYLFRSKAAREERKQKEMEVAARKVRRIWYSLAAAVLIAGLFLALWLYAKSKAHQAESNLKIANDKSAEAQSQKKRADEEAGKAVRALGDLKKTLKDLQTQKEAGDRTNFALVVAELALNRTISQLQSKSTELQLANKKISETLRVLDQANGALVGEQNSLQAANTTLEKLNGDLEAKNAELNRAKTEALRRQRTAQSQLFAAAADRYTGLSSVKTAIAAVQNLISQDPKELTRPMDTAEEKDAVPRALESLAHALQSSRQISAASFGPTVKAVGFNDKTRVAAGIQITQPPGRSQVEGETTTKSIARLMTREPGPPARTRTRTLLQSKSTLSKLPFAPGRNTGAVTAVSLSLDGSLAAQGTDKGTIYLHDAPGESLRSSSRRNPVSLLSFDPEAKFLLAASSGGGWRLFRTDNMKRVSKNDEKTLLLTNAAVSSNGEWLLVSTKDGAIRRKHLRPGGEDSPEKQTILETFSPTDNPLPLDIARSGLAVYAGTQQSRPYCVYLRSSGSGGAVTDCDYSSRIVSLALNPQEVIVTFGPDADLKKYMIAVLTEDGTLLLKIGPESSRPSLRTIATLQKILPEAQSVRFSGGGANLIVVARNGNTRLWRVADLLQDRNYTPTPVAELISDLWRDAASRHVFTGSGLQKILERCQPFIQDQPSPATSGIDPQLPRSSPARE
jgi:hypothetical protein